MPIESDAVSFAREPYLRHLLLTAEEDSSKDKSGEACCRVVAQLCTRIASAPPSHRVSKVAPIDIYDEFGKQGRRYPVQGVAQNATTALYLRIAVYRKNQVSRTQSPSRWSLTSDTCC